ncbi:MAG: zf-HC2 domain-containing protein [Gemmatimonadales bacterium]|jgi:anti-sigma factor RsiW
MAMNCHEFLERYSDWRDGLIGADLRQRMSDHLQSCPRCTQYHARVARGVTVLKSLRELEPTWLSRRRLASRLAGPPLTLYEPVTPAPAGIMVALMLMTAAALFVWEAATGPGSRAAQQPVQRPRPVVVANPAPPFVSFAHLSVPAFTGPLRTPGAGEAPFGVRTALSP